MTILQNQAIKYIQEVPSEKLPGVIDYLKYLSEQPKDFPQYK